MAPESVAQVYLSVVRDVILHVRYRIRYSRPLPNDQLHDLMDAIHNIPDMLAMRNDYFTLECFRDAFRVYDERWATGDEISLINFLEQAEEHESML